MALRKPKVQARSTFVPQEQVQATGQALMVRLKDVIVPRKAGIPNEELEKRISHRLDLIHHYLTDEVYLGRLAFSSLKDITVAEAIQMDKLMALRGQPSIIVGHNTYKRLEELGPALIAELTKRGLKPKTPEPKGEVIDATYSDIS